MTGNRTAAQDSCGTCETLERARRVAYICAAYQQPYELVVCDADRRVLHRELIDANTETARVRKLVMLAPDRA